MTAAAPVEHSKAMLSTNSAPEMAHGLSEKRMMWNLIAAPKGRSKVATHARGGLGHNKTAQDQWLFVSAQLLQWRGQAHHSQSSLCTARHQTHSRQWLRWQNRTARSVSMSRTLGTSAWLIQ